MALHEDLRPKLVSQFSTTGQPFDMRAFIREQETVEELDVVTGTTHINEQDGNDEQQTTSDTPN